MDSYIGGDVHSASVTFEVLKESGKRIRRDLIETNGRALVDFIEQIPGDRHLCIEEGEWSQWLYELLAPRVAEMVVYRREWTPGSKNDAIDAHDLAEKLRTGKVTRRVYKDAKRFTELRAAARTYTMLTRDVARVKNRIKSIYRSRGVDCSGEAAYKPKARHQLAKQLPVPMQRCVGLLGTELDYLIELKTLAETTMKKASHRYRISRILETAPGFGPIRVAQMIPIVITPHRFRTKRQFWAYCGFGIVTRSTSDWIRENGRWVRGRTVQTRGLSFSHNRMLKAIFKGAATTVISQSEPNPLREVYERLLENGTRPNLVKLTIARKIAAIVLAMWKKEEPYDLGKV
jgi:transposase